MNEHDVAELNRIVKECNHIVFFGGAGVSTESGIPDFRSKDGLYNQHDVKFDRYSPEYLLSIDCLVDHPDVFYEFYRQKLNTAGIEPNRAHYKLAEMEKAGKLDGIITQNIDGLHQRAGSKNVIELHGNASKFSCSACGREENNTKILETIKKEQVPKCKHCCGLMKPKVVLYEEPLYDGIAESAVKHISTADMLIVGGTSLAVYPAASFVRYFKGKHLVMINKSETGYDVNADLIIRENIGEVFEKVMNIIVR